MTDEQQHGSKAEMGQTARRNALKDFLENSPPGKVDIVPLKVEEDMEGFWVTVQLPSLHLHCETCKGTRIFECADSAFGFRYGGNFDRLVDYVCRNCKRYEKTYALRFTPDGHGKGSVMKIGEQPTFGPPMPDKVLKLFGSEREYFLKGRRAENQGLGIAAFAYYRRVIEAKRNVLIDEIIRVAEAIDAPEGMIADLRRAKEEKQFTKAVDAIRHGIPQALLINGHNPLLLLHDALSDGVHDRTDEECLRDATSIRIVLIEFVDKLTQALKSDSELTSAVSALVNRKAKQAQRQQ